MSIFQQGLKIKKHVGTKFMKVFYYVYIPTMIVLGKFYCGPY